MTSIFQIIGPVMVGPSSSHTAGAARLGNIARRICGEQPVRVDFYLHGSFAKTWKGHGTGKALLGGIMGMDPADERIADSFHHAMEAGLQYNFHTADLGEVHPNSVKIVMQTADGRIWEMMGSSVGGGKVIISSLNGMDIEFSGDYPTIITFHRDQPGAVAQVSEIISHHNINIAFLKVFRSSRGSDASMVIECDQEAEPDLLEQIKALQVVKEVMFINAGITPAN
ncbi:MAG TPA: L-serine ammonia-lyase, iron-sulfur-dependent, subunit beta [Syntrophomonas sp.]|nr:L-serine ammonia-lyase, iron-sulfur-dependent, subunit beta [Syntrophomonas sp.]